MERVAFLVESTGERIGCLLNPEAVSIQRVAGLRPLQTPAGVVTGRDLVDDPLVQVGGGVTEIELELLFDVGLAGSSVETQDVRNLTAPLWSLAEGRAVSKSLTEPGVVRFIWGKAWNMPGVVVAAAERLEHFAGDGTPRRSSIKIRFRRVAEPPVSDPPPLDPDARLDELVDAANEAPPESVQIHRLLGDGPVSDPDKVEPGAEIPPAGETLQDIATAEYGHPSFWRFVAAVNDLANPVRVAAGTLLRLPPFPRARSKL